MRSAKRLSRARSICFVERMRFGVEVALGHFDLRIRKVLVLSTGMGLLPIGFLWASHELPMGLISQTLRMYWFEQQVVSDNTNIIVRAPSTRRHYEYNGLSVENSQALQIS